MPKRPKIYEKISGRGPLRFTRLWLAADHLLTSFSIGGVETYQRFYFHKIEAFIIRTTARRLIWNAIFGGLALLTGAIALVVWSLSKGHATRTQPDRVIAAILAGMAGISFLLVLFNTLCGPTCAVFVQTATGLKPMGAPGRYRKALQMVERVSPLILSAQTGNAETPTPAGAEAPVATFPA